MIPPDFLWNCRYNYKEIHIYHGYILQSWDYFSSLLHYQHTSPTVCDTLNAILIKLSAVTLELFTHAVFSCHRNSIMRLLPSGSKKDEVRGCWIGTVQRIRNNSAPHCCICLPWLILLCRRTWFTFTFLFGWALCRHCFNLMSAPVSLSWLWHLPQRIPLTRCTVPADTGHNFNQRNLHFKFFLEWQNLWCRSIVFLAGIHNDEPKFHHQ
jgi:hypothetical protein